MEANAMNDAHENMNAQRPGVQNVPQEVQMPRNQDTVLPFLLANISLFIRENYHLVWIAFIVAIIVYYYWPVISFHISKLFYSDKPIGKKSHWRWIIFTFFFFFSKLAPQRLVEYDEAVRLARQRQQEMFLKESQGKIQEINERNEKKKEEKFQSVGAVKQDKSKPKSTGIFSF